MELRIEKKDLNRALSVINSSVSRTGEGAMEIVKFVLFEGRGDKVDLTVTNKTSTVFMSVPAVCVDEFSTCVPHKQLNSLVKLLDDVIEIKQVRSRVLISQNKTKLQIPVRPGEDYPSRETLDVPDGSEYPKVSVTILSFVTALQMASLALGSIDNGQWFLKALKFYGEMDELKIYSCDGHQISRATITGVSNFPSGESVDLLLPALSVSGLTAFLKASKQDSVEIQFHEKKVAFVTDLGKLVISTSLGKFPDIEKVLNNDREFTFELESGETSLALQRALFFSSDNGYCEIKLEHDSLTIYSKDKSLGESVEEISIDCPAFKSQGMEIALNGRNLANYVDQIPGKTRFSLSFDEREPMYLESEKNGVKFKYLLMRMVHNDPTK